VLAAQRGKQKLQLFLYFVSGKNLIYSTKHKKFYLLFFHWLFSDNKGNTKISSPEKKKSAPVGYNVHFLMEWLVMASV
jgi:hypothetical protein